MQARFLPEPYRSIARLFARVTRRGRTAIRLGFSRESWKFLFRYVNSIARTRSSVPASQVARTVREEKRKLSTLMLFLFGDFRAAMDQALGDLESRPADAEDEAARRRLRNRVGRLRMRRTSHEPAGSGPNPRRREQTATVLPVYPDQGTRAGQSGACRPTPRRPVPCHGLSANSHEPGRQAGRVRFP